MKNRRKRINETKIKETMRKEWEDQKKPQKRKKSGSSNTRLSGAETGLELPGLVVGRPDRELEHREKRTQYSQKLEKKSLRQNLFKSTRFELSYDGQSQDIDCKEHRALSAIGEQVDLTIGRRGRNLLGASNVVHPAGPHLKRSGRAPHQDDGQARSKPTKIKLRLPNKKVVPDPKESHSDEVKKCEEVHSPFTPSKEQKAKIIKNRSKTAKKLEFKTKARSVSLNTDSNANLLKRRSLKTSSKTKACEMDVKFIERPAHVVREVIKDLGTVEAIKSDVYYVISEKELNLDEILKLPSESEIEKEKEQDALDLDIITSADEVWKEDEAFNAWKKLRQEREEARRKRFEENGKRRKQLKSELTESQILNSLQKHKQLLIGIKSGTIFAARHEAYNKGGEAHWLLNERVFDGMVKDEDLEFILDQIDNITATDSMQKIISSDYNFKVLLPTFLVQVSLQ